MYWKTVHKNVKGCLYLGRDGMMDIESAWQLWATLTTATHIFITIFMQAYDALILGPWELADKELRNLMHVSLPRAISVRP